MAVMELWRRRDLEGTVKPEYIDGNFFTQDSVGNLVGVKCYKDGAEVALTGSVTGYCVLPSGETVSVAGTRSGNQASILVPQSALAYTGPLGITLKLIDGNTITTLMRIIVVVYRSKTDTVITPSSQIITDWANQISAALQEVEDASAEQDAKIADLKSALDNAGINQIIKSGSKTDSYRGIDVSVKGDEITVNGTATGNVRFKLSGDTILHAVTVTSSWCQDLNNIPAGSKKIQMEIVSGSGTCTVALYNKDAGVIKAFGITTASFGTYDYSFESANAELGCLVVYIGSGNVVSNLIIKVRLIDTGDIDDYIGASPIINNLSDKVFDAISIAPIYDIDGYYYDGSGRKYVAQGLCICGNNIVISMNSVNTQEYPDVKDKFMGLLVIDKTTLLPASLSQNPIIYDIASLGLPIDTSHSNSLSYVQETNMIWCRACNDSTAILINGSTFAISGTETMDFTGGFAFDNTSKTWCYLQYRNTQQYSIRIMDENRTKLISAHYPYRQGTAQGVQYHANKIYIPTSRAAYNSVLVYDVVLDRVVASWYFDYDGEFEDIDVSDNGEVYIVANKDGLRLFRGYYKPYNEYYGNVKRDIALYNSEIATA